MKSNTKRLSRGAARTPDPSRGRRRGRGRLGVAWVATLAALASVVLLVRGASWFGARRPRPLPPAPDPLAAMAASAAYDTAAALMKRGENAESLPYFRRAMRGVAVDFWEIHYNYAGAVYNLTRAFETRRGLQVPWARSSVEQVAFLSEALVELDRAERLARTPADKAQVLARRAQLYEVWGLPWDAFTAYRRAGEYDPSRADVARRGDITMDRMEHPERYRDVEAAP